MLRRVEEGGPGLGTPLLPRCAGLVLDSGLLRVGDHSSPCSSSFWPLSPEYTVDRNPSQQMQNKVALERTEMALGTGPEALTMEVINYCAVAMKRAHVLEFPP
ncbi:hypothetical protein GCM10023196_009930 [Actinoallomurus vinaceus]|uniref:Uncharacterized protein n=1 Tax=Actinoallomurus vinaceus TaxID=1080074 RepID=A0ABP8U4S4_9ACTN